MLNDINDRALRSEHHLQPPEEEGLGYVDKFMDCPDCKGDGFVGETCDECHGLGDLDCHVCDGSGKIDCKKCYGDGCDECEMTGEVECEECVRGRVKCNDCDGVGIIDQECKTCNGSGYVSI